MEFINRAMDKVKNPSFIVRRLAGERNSRFSIFFILRELEFECLGMADSQVTLREKEKSIA